MKITEIKKHLLPFVFTLSVIVAAVLPAIIFIPDTVSYSVSTTQNSTTDQVFKGTTPEGPFYTSIYGISEDGPFKILADGDSIYVFSGDMRLYKIKASLSEFPENDRNTICSGIEAPDKASLYEIVQHMES